MAGTIRIDWGATAGAAGYRVYYGSSSRSYDASIDVGNQFHVTIDGLDPCRSYHLAVRAYDAEGNLSDYSNELIGTVRPSVTAVEPSVLTQGEIVPVVVHGEMFKPAAELRLDPDSIPTDVDGNPLVRLESYDVIDCWRIQALISLEPMFAGSRASPVGTLQPRFIVINPDDVFGVGSPPVHIQLAAKRINVERGGSDSPSPAVDGQDLVRLTHAYGSREGEPVFDPDADLNGDALVDGVDLAVLASQFGRCWDGEGWSAQACMGRRPVGFDLAAPRTIP